MSAPLFFPLKYQRSFLFSYYKKILPKLFLLPVLITGILAPLATSYLFIDGFIFPKWLFIYSSAFIAFAIIVHKGSFNLPHLTSFQHLILGILLCMLIFNFFRLDLDLRSNSTLNRLTFLIITLYTLTFFSNKKLTDLSNIQVLISPFIIASIIIILLSLTYIVEFYFHAGAVTHNFLWNATFGNPNMLAQFLGFSLILILPLMDQKLRIHHRLIKLLCATLIIYLYYLQCRSVLLALGIVTIYILWSRLVCLKSLLEIFSYACLIIGTLNFLQPFPLSSSTKFLKFPAPTFILSENKRASSQERFEIWKGSLNMVKDHPFGVGPDNFEYAFIPYKKKTALPLSEDYIEKSPHCEYLRYLTEDGIPATLLGIFLIISCLYRGLSNRNVSLFLRHYFIAFITFLSIESFFQFPLENPISFYICAIMTGFFLARFGIPFHELKVRRVYLTLILIIYASLAGSLTFAHYYTGTSPYDSHKIQLAAKLSPANWHTQLYQIENFIRDHRYQEAIWHAKLELKKRSYNFPALYLLGISQYYSGLFNEACKTLKDYDNLFDQQSQYHQDISKLCPIIQPK